MGRQAIRIHPQDNVLVALSDLKAGETVLADDQRYRLVADVPRKHKFTIEALEPGGRIVMYGVTVGSATQTIPRGARLTTDNVRHQVSGFAARAPSYRWEPPDVSRWLPRTFQGFHRPNGHVGTANYWLVVPLVFCENRNVDTLKQAFTSGLGLAKPSAYQEQVEDLVHFYQAGLSDQILAYSPKAGAATFAPRRVFPNIDGIKFLTHEGGCGGTREDARNLCGLLAGYIGHPNVAGATVLSLGCQHAQVDLLRGELAKRHAATDKPLLVFEQQKSQSEFAMVSDAIKSTFLALIEANAAVRCPAPLSRLTVGLKCGGSDGFSGISANPVLGHLADWIAGVGGSTILSEFPELCGVEQELIDRCATLELGQRFASLMQSYADRALAVGSGFGMNPSPGNIRDGLLTDAMKSAGAARKGGTSPITGVLDYPEPVTAAGLNLLCTPGNDVEAVTGQVGAGATVVLFTTGLGTPTGNPIAPVVKIATNTELARRMPDIIDFDCGRIVAGEQTIPESAAELLECVIRVASGELRPKAQLLEQDDFIPWKRGVSL